MIISSLNFFFRFLRDNRKFEGKAGQKETEGEIKVEVLYIEKESMMAHGFKHSVLRKEKAFQVEM